MNNSDFRTLLLQVPGVQLTVNTRVFPLKIPDEVWSSATEKPCLVYSTEAVERERTFCGTNDLKATRVFIDAYARDFDEAARLGKLVADGLTDYSGTVGSTHFDTVVLDTELDLDDEDPGLYRRHLSFIIWNRSI